MTVATYRICWSWTFILALAPASRSQEGSLANEVRRAVETFQSGDFYKAVAELTSAVTMLRAQTASSKNHQALIEAYLTLGLSYFALEQQGAAAESFKEVLLLEPSHNLDADRFAPGVISLFRQASDSAERARRLAELNHPEPLPPPYATLPSEQFDQAKLLLPDGDKYKETDVSLRFMPEGIYIDSRKDHDGLRVVRYEQIQYCEYAYAERRNINSLFKKRKHHWLTVYAATEKLILRLDEGNYQAVLQAMKVREFEIRGNVPEG